MIGFQNENDLESVSWVQNEIDGEINHEIRRKTMKTYPNRSTRMFNWLF